MLKQNQNMKIIILVTAALLLINSLAYAASLQWKAGTGQTDGYKIYYGTNANSQSNSVKVGNVTQYSLSNLHLNEKTQYFFCVAAYNAAGESPTTNVLSYTPGDATPPSPPMGLKSY